MVGNFLTLPSLHAADSLANEGWKGESEKSGDGKVGDKANYYITRIIQKGAKPGW